MCFGKVFIFNNFSSANIQSQNKLLKILEEPPKNTFIILNVTNINKVLPTVLSRCKKIRLLPLTKQEIQNNVSLNALSDSEKESVKLKRQIEHLADENVKLKKIIKT